MYTVTDEIADVLTAAGTSPWLREALRTALLRDPMDAANDAALLAQLLTGKVEAMIFLEQWRSPTTDARSRLAGSGPRAD